MNDSLSPLISPTFWKPPAVQRGESFRGLKRLPSIGDLLAVSDGCSIAKTTSSGSNNKYSPPPLRTLRSESRVIVDMEDVDVVTPTNLLRMRSKLATTALTQEQLQEMFCGGGGSSNVFNKPINSVEASDNMSDTKDRARSRSSSHHSDTAVVETTTAHSTCIKGSPLDRPLSREYSRLPEIGSSSSTPPRMDHDSRNTVITSLCNNIQPSHLSVPGSGSNSNSRPHSATGSLRFSGEKVHLSPAKLPPVILNSCSSCQRTPDGQQRSSTKQRSPAVTALMQDDSDDDQSLLSLGRRSYSVNDTAKSSKADDGSVSSVRRKLLAAQQEDHRQHIVDPVGDNMHK